MKKKRSKNILMILAILLILIGIGLICFPAISNFLFEKNVEKDKEDFIKKVSEDQQEESLLDKLYKDLQERNEWLYKSEQSNLVDPFSYEQPTIDLSEYGIENNTIGYIKIPKMGIELPIILGANSTNMRKGAVHLTETSYPIGGNNTNSVIAAHRGYGGAQLFRYIDKLDYGDKIYIQNFREELLYVVYEIKLVTPDAIDELAIQPAKDIVTLITCHPYRVNTQRYIVKAERVKVENLN